MNTLRSYRALIWLPALALLAAGCLISGTKVFEFDVIRDGNGGQPIDISAGSFEMVPIDLTGNDTFEEHQSDVKLIDRAGFTATVANSSATATSMSIYFDTKDPADPVVLGEATRILNSIALGASGTTNITYKESEEAIENFSAFQEAVAGGKLRLISVADGNVDFQVTAMLLIITFTVGL